MTSEVEDDFSGPETPKDSKPDISGLSPAVVDGQFILGVGDKVVMEVSTHSGRWLHTREYRVVSVDPDTGNVRLFNTDLCQNAGANFRKIGQGFDMRIPPTRGKPIGTKRRGRPPALDKKPLVSMEPKKRGRPRKNPQAVE